MKHLQGVLSTLGKNSRLKQQRRQENSGSTSTNKSKKILIGSIIAAGIAVVALIVILSWPSETTPNKESKGNEDHSQHTTQNSSKNDSSDQQENDKKQTEKADETPAEPNVTPSWRLLKSPALTSEPVQLSFQFSGYKDKQIITDYEKYHDKKMHLIAVSTDLNNFLHVHPDMQADGTFNASLDLKRSTTYKIYADGKSASKGLVNETAGLYVREPKDIPPNWDPRQTNSKFHLMFRRN